MVFVGQKVSLLFVHFLVMLNKGMMLLCVFAVLVFCRDSLQDRKNLQTQGLVQEVIRPTRGNPHCQLTGCRRKDHFVDLKVETFCTNRSRCGKV